MCLFWILYSKCFSTLKCHSSIIKCYFIDLFFFPQKYLVSFTYFDHFYFWNISIWCMFVLIICNHFIPNILFIIKCHLATINVISIFFNLLILISQVFASKHILNIFTIKRFVRNAKISNFQNICKCWK